MIEVSIGDVAAADYPAIPPLLAQLGYPTDADRVGRRIERVLAAGGRVLVARAGQLPLGLAAVAFVPLVHHDDELCRITALVVAGHARGQGIGRQLVALVEQLALERACLRLEVTSADHRAPAHAFYRSLGFSERPRRFIKQLRATDRDATAPAADPNPAPITGERPAIL